MRPAFPTAKDVDRIMAFEPPITGETAAERAKRECDCRDAVAYTLRLLRKYDMTPISRVRQRLERYAKKRPKHPRHAVTRSARGIQPLGVGRLPGGQAGRAAA